MRISVDKENLTPVYMQIVDGIKNLTVKGELPHGYVLPSERVLAAKLGVHRNTVSKAYGALKELELVESIQGKNHTISYNLNDIKMDANMRIDWNRMMKDDFVNMELEFDKLYSKSYEKSRISFAAGIAARDIYKNTDVSDAVKEVMDEISQDVFFYNPYQGDDKLIEGVSKFLMKKGIWADHFTTQILSESNQAVDFLITLLLTKGEVVFTTETVSPDVHRAIRIAGGRIITIPEDRDGMVIDNLEPLIQKYMPKFLYISSGFSDPRGSTLSFKRKKRLLELSYKYGFPIIENDETSELNYGDKKIMTLKSLDVMDNVIYIYNFAMTFMPGAGMAAVVAPKKVIEGLSYLVSVRLIGGDWLAQKLLAKFLSNGMFYSKLELFKSTYKEKLELMCSHLDRLAKFNVRYIKPKGGVYIWCEFPENIPVLRLYDEADKRGVGFIPGYIFYPELGKKNNALRLNFSLPSKGEIDQGMDILIELVKKIEREGVNYE
ncbi:MAG: PLP-dependent aminotransferase family protein [Anaerovoracaceae bacterium]